MAGCGLPLPVGPVTDSGGNFVELKRFLRLQGTKPQSFSFEESPFSDGWRGSWWVSAGQRGDLELLDKCTKKEEAWLNTLMLTVKEGRFWPGVGLGLQSPKCVVETRAVLRQSTAIHLGSIPWQLIPGFPRGRRSAFLREPARGLD